MQHNKNALMKGFGLFVESPFVGESVAGKYGFTLIELLVVILIIGILAAMALPQYRSAVAMSRISTMYAMVRAIDQAQQRFYMQTNRYSGDFAALDVSFPADFSAPSAAKRKNDKMSCSLGKYIDPRNGAVSYRIRCDDLKLKIGLEKYHHVSYYKCWTYANDELGHQVCRNLSGLDNPDGTSTNRTQKSYRIGG